MQDIVRHYEVYGDKREVVEIWAAYEYAEKTHEGVLRKS
jgi:hypothetical protein